MPWAVPPPLLLLLEVLVLAWGVVQRPMGVRNTGVR